MTNASTRRSLNVQAWRYYLRFYRGSFLKLFLTVFISAAQAAINLAILFLVKYIFDKVIFTGKFSTLTLIGLGLFSLYLLNSGLTIWIRYLILKITKIVTQKLRSEMLEKFYTLSHFFNTEADRGKLHTIAVQDTERLDVMGNALIGQLMPSVFIGVALSGILIYFNALLFLLLFFLVPFFIVVSRAIGKIVRKHVRAFHKSFEAYSKGIFFVLQMMDLTRIQAAEEFELERQQKNIEQLRTSSNDMAWLTTAYNSIQTLIVASSTIFIFIIGGRSIATGRMTLGEFMSFFAAVNILKNHLLVIIGCFPQLIEGTESLNTLYNWIEIRDTVPYFGKKRIDFQGKITLESVDFNFKDKSILHNINLTLSPAAPIAVVGSNGAGKSTIANLILGLYRPQAGQVYADDHPFTELDLTYLRRYIGVVRQDPIIFSGTILENIAYGNPDAQWEQVVEASKKATAHDFIQPLPQGYETFVGESGTKLSGGERQRIAIARALMGQPRLLILDEPDNHLDNASIQKLMQNLRNLDPVPAILIISHNMDILRDVKEINILEKGGIKLKGDYETLSLKNWKPIGVSEQ